MKHNHVVLFEEGKVPRILFNVDPSKFHPSSILVNPVLPRGIPPHRWKKVKNWIEVLPEPPKEAKHEPIVMAMSKPKLERRHYVLMGVISVTLATILHIILR